MKIKKSDTIKSATQAIQCLRIQSLAAHDRIRKPRPDRTDATKLVNGLDKLNKHELASLTDLLILAGCSISGLSIAYGREMVKREMREDFDK
jgi:hypothetical protein